MSFCRFAARLSPSWLGGAFSARCQLGVNFLLPLAEQLARHVVELAAAGYKGELSLDLFREGDTQAGLGRRQYFAVAHLEAVADDGAVQRTVVGSDFENGGVLAGEADVEVLHERSARAPRMRRNPATALRQEPGDIDAQFQPPGVGGVGLADVEAI